MEQLRFDFNPPAPPKKIVNRSIPRVELSVPSPQQIDNSHLPYLERIEKDLRDACEGFIGSENAAETRHAIETTVNRYLTRLRMTEPVAPIAIRVNPAREDYQISIEYTPQDVAYIQRLEEAQSRWARNNPDPLDWLRYDFGQIYSTYQIT